MSAKLSRCPVQGCLSSPSPLFCAFHWARVSGDVRRAVLNEFKLMTSSRRQTPSPGMAEALGLAVREATAGPAPAPTPAPRLSFLARAWRWLRLRYVKARYGPMIDAITAQKALETGRLP